MEYILSILVSLIISLALTPLVKKLAHKVGAIDIPKDDRRVHKNPIPRLGGLAMYIGFIISTMIFTNLDRSIVGMIIGATIIVAMGVVDDIKPLPAKIKLSIQIIAALVLVAFGIKVEYITNFLKPGELIFFKPIVSIPLTVFWIVGITNTVNLIDGLDGLAAGISAIAAITLAYVAHVLGQGTIVILTLAVAGACIGFLPYNFNPAKIFMGDTGSLFLGFILASISVEGALKGPATLAIVVPVLALGLPIFDTTFAILRRVSNGRPIMEADKGHLHHRLLSLGLCQRRAVLVLYLISSMLGISAAFVLNQKYLDSAVMLLVTAAIVAVPVNHNWIQKQKSTNKE